MATLIIFSSVDNVHSVTLPKDQAMDCMADLIVSGIHCELWQGMNCLATWERPDTGVRR